MLSGGGVRIAEAVSVFPEYLKIIFALDYLRVVLQLLQQVFVPSTVLIGQLLAEFGEHIFRGLGEKFAAEDAECGRPLVHPGPRNDERVKEIVQP
jgi:hypothetical protein